MALVTNRLMSDLCVDVIVVNPLIDIYAKMQHKNKYLDGAVKQKNKRYAERCNAAGLGTTQKLRN